MKPTTSVLAVFAHPDDESLSAGGLLARQAEAGARTAVVTATWAEGTGRAAELAQALRVLGAGPPRLLGYADARVPESAPGSPRLLDAPLEEAVSRLVAHIRDVRPDAVVTHDALGGLTGHPDHARTHRITARAVAEAGRLGLHPGTPWRPRALYLATHPDSAARTLGPHLMRPGRPMHFVPDAQITTTLDVHPWLPRKLRAILAHRSEVTRGALPGRLAALPPADQQRLLSTEWYIHHQISAPER